MRPFKCTECELSEGGVSDKSMTFERQPTADSRSNGQRPAEQARPDRSGPQRTVDQPRRIASRTPPSRCARLERSTTSVSAKSRDRLLDQLFQAIARCVV